MIALWSRLSLFTRMLTIVVLLSAIGATYVRTRLQPQRRAVEASTEVVVDLRGEVRRARDRVQRLEREAELAVRWSDYASILEAQSTGRSLRDVIATCGTASGPAVEVVGADFERKRREGRPPTMAIRLHVRGAYEELVRLFDELDRTFPPIVLESSTLTRTESGETIAAVLEGVIHDAR